VKNNQHFSQIYINGREKKEQSDVFVTTKTTVTER